MGRKKNSSDFLKECIADALFILLRTKSIESITVREITELANVSRITYYRNFTPMSFPFVFSSSFILFGILYRL